MSDIDVAVAEPYFQDAIAAWPDALRAKIVQVLWNKYSKLLDIRIKHERDDFLLGDAVDIRDAFKHPAANKKNPEILSEAGVLGALLSQESLVAGTRNTRCRQNGDQNAKGGPSGPSSLASVVGGARNNRFLLLVERTIPKLAA